MSLYDDLLQVCDADAAARRPGVARMRGLVSAMPAELVLADEDEPQAGGAE